MSKWFIIVNPTSGNGSSKKKWPKIFNELVAQKIDFEFVFTKYEKHSVLLVKNAIENGYIKIICVGGDGTLHNIVNGILLLKPKNLNKIKVGIIPIGTGNDWVKTYNIPLNYKKAIEIIKIEKTIKQDIGKITFLNRNTSVYFNNSAGIGFDGYIVKTIHNYKNLGAFAYLYNGLISIKKYKKPSLKITFNTTKINSKTFMLVIGLCKFSGGSMQLTNKPNTTDGLFDISYLKKIDFFTIILNIFKLFNGKINNLKFIKCYKTASLKVEVKNKAYIQADGELIGNENFICEILPKSLHFIIK